MKKRNYVYGLFLILMLCFGLGTMSYAEVTVHAAAVKKQNGWVTENGKKYYYIDGQKAKGKTKIGGKTYYFNSVHGYMQTGWYKTSAGNYYYFGGRWCHAYRCSGNRFCTVLLQEFWKNGSG